MKLDIKKASWLMGWPEARKSVGRCRWQERFMKVGREASGGQVGRVAANRMKHSPRDGCLWG